MKTLSVRAMGILSNAHQAHLIQNKKLLGKWLLSLPPQYGERPGIMKFRACGWVTAKELYDWASLPWLWKKAKIGWRPNRHKCPTCGRFYVKPKKAT